MITCTLLYQFVEVEDPLLSLYISAHSKEMNVSCVGHQILPQLRLVGELIWLYHASPNVFVFGFQMLVKRDRSTWLLVCLCQFEKSWTKDSYILRKTLLYLHGSFEDVFEVLFLTKLIIHWVTVIPAHSNARELRRTDIRYLKALKKYYQFASANLSKFFGGTTCPFPNQCPSVFLIKLNQFQGARHIICTSVTVSALYHSSLMGSSKVVYR